jgi:hypothetical protein
MVFPFQLVIFEVVMFCVGLGVERPNPHSATTVLSSTSFLALAPEVPGCCDFIEPDLSVALDVDENILPIDLVDKSGLCNCEIFAKRW